MAPSGRHFQYEKCCIRLNSKRLQLLILEHPMTAQPSLELKTAHACFGGAQRYYEHFSSEIGLAMKFSVYLPPKAVAGEKVPALLYLAGLTCTEETFMIRPVPSA